MAKAQLKESQELVFQIRAKMTKQCQIRTQRLPGEARPEGRPQRLGGQALEAGNGEDSGARTQKSLKSS